jgi:hypothetical protein
MWMSRKLSLSLRLSTKGAVIDPQAVFEESTIIS